MDSSDTTPDSPAESQAVDSPVDSPAESAAESAAESPTEGRAEWQVSRGFQGRPVDCLGAETAGNRSPEAISLRTS